jgi:hypothetical protein
MTQVRNIVIRLLIACLALMPFSAHAGMVGTDAVIQQSALTNRAGIQQFLARAEVQSQLQALGISPEQARARVNALTDDELARVAGQVGALPAGGDATPIILGIIIGIIAAIVYIYWK